MLHFVKRSTSDIHEPLLILQPPPTYTFGDVCTNAVRSANKLGPNGVTVKVVPFNYNIPNLVSQCLGKFVDPKIFKV